MGFTVPVCQFFAMFEEKDTRTKQHLHSCSQQIYTQTSQCRRPHVTANVLTASWGTMDSEHRIQVAWIQGHWGRCSLPHGAAEIANQFVNIKSYAIRLLHLDDESQSFFFKF